MLIKLQTIKRLIISLPLFNFKNIQIRWRIIISIYFPLLSLQTSKHNIKFLSFVIDCIKVTTICWPYYLLTKSDEMGRSRVSRSTRGRGFLLTIQNDALSFLFDTDPPQLISREVVCKERGYKFLQLNMTPSSPCWPSRTSIIAERV